jgi:hypothetical protein
MSNSPIQIQEATRAGTRLAIAFSGPTESGKTLTALQFAYGLANRDAKKIGFIDTENRRGRLYFDRLPNKERFFIADFSAPFSPERYVEAIKAFEKSNIEVLIIDSATHEWAGMGGCLEIVAGVPPRVDPWKIVKPRHQAFIDYMLQSPLHIIVCLRAKPKVEKVKTTNSKGEETMGYKQLGIQPIQQAEFMFDMTASLLMSEKGMKQEVRKCPDELRPHLGRGTGYITVEDGEAVRAWVDGGGIIDPAIDRWRDILLNTAKKGIVELERVWKSEVPKHCRDALGKSFLDTVKASAQAFDNEKKTVTGNKTIDAINAASPVVVQEATDDKPLM